MATTRTRSKRSADHVVLGDKGQFKCLHCGATHDPFDDGHGGRKAVEIWAMAALSKAFTKEHATCPKPTKPRCPFCGSTEHDWLTHTSLTRSPDEWLQTGDTGMSSRAILAHMLGRPHDTTWGPRAPSDPEDFGRCSRLLAAPWAKGWRERIGEMVKYPGWAGKAKHWAELEALLVEEAPTGNAPKLWARMRSLET